jgi:hypothetical protein
MSSRLNLMGENLVLMSTGKNMMTHVAAALMPAGNAVTKSAKRTPKGESWDDFIGQT